MFAEAGTVTSANIIEDREGNLWFAQNGGVSRLQPDYRAFQRYTGISHAGEGGRDAIGPLDAHAEGARGRREIRRRHRLALARNRHDDDVARQAGESPATDSERSIVL